MKSDIILSGVGGQGILSIAAAIGMAAIDKGLKLKQAEVHGMSQRGGAVQSHLRISDSDIASDLIPLGAADLIISVEPMEALRYLPYLSKDAWIITNINPYVNIPDYPGHEEILKEIRKIKNHVIIDADRMAKDLNSARSSNMVILGAASPFIDIPEEYFISGISQIFEKKGNEIISINKKAFLSGKQAALHYSV